MPFGIDTPTLFAMIFGVLGPTMLATGDPVLAWKVGMGVTVAIGVAKLALAFAGDWVRRIVPRAALLGSIAGVSILLIAFLPMLKVLTRSAGGIPLARADPRRARRADRVARSACRARSRPSPWGPPSTGASAGPGSRRAATC